MTLDRSPEGRPCTRRRPRAQLALSPSHRPLLLLGGAPRFRLEASEAVAEARLCHEGREFFSFFLGGRQVGEGIVFLQRGGRWAFLSQGLVGLCLCLLEGEGLRDAMGWVKEILASRRGPWQKEKRQLEQNIPLAQQFFTYSYS